MKRVLIKAYVNGNLGDDLFINILTSRYPNTKFEIFDKKEYKKSFSSISNLKYIPATFLFKIVRKVFMLFPQLFKSRYSSVVEIGGSIFQQINNTDVVSKERDTLSKRLPYFVIGSNFGPCKTNEFIENYNNFFKYIDGTVFRDEQSYELFSHLKNVSLAPDVVFSYQNILPKEEVKKKIVICPIDLNYERVNKDFLQKNIYDYEKRIADLILHLFKKGFRIEMISFCDGENDNVAIRRIMKNLPDFVRSNVIFKDKSSLDYKISSMNSAEYIIGSRFHSMILSWKLRKKALILSYNRKIDDTISYLYPEQYHMSISDFSGNKGILFKNFNTISSKKLAECETKSDKQFAYLDKFINEKDLRLNE